MFVFLHVHCTGVLLGVHVHVALTLFSVRCSACWHTRLLCAFLEIFFSFVVCVIEFTCMLALTSTCACTSIYTHFALCICVYICVLYMKGWVYLPIVAITFHRDTCTFKWPGSLHSRLVKSRREENVSWRLMSSMTCRIRTFRWLSHIRPLTVCDSLAYRIGLFTNIQAQRSCSVALCAIIYLLS